MVESINYYEILEIRKDATDSEIKYAYKRAIHKYHPDVSENRNAAEMFKNVAKAYKTLNDPVKRMEYDRAFTTNASEKSEKTKNVKAIKPEKIKNIKFIIKEAFDKKRLESFFEKVKKARAETRRKKFVEREIHKFDSVYPAEEIALSDIEIRARLISSTNPYVRIHAAKIIAAKRDNSFFYDLVKLLSDLSPLVRKEVVKTLGILKDYRGVNFLSNAIYDYDSSVRYEAAVALRNYNDIRAVAALLKLVSDKEAAVVVESIYSLGVIGDSDTLPVIKKMFQHESIKVKKAAIEVYKTISAS